MYYNSHVNHAINVPNEEIIVTEGDFNGIIEKDHDDFDHFHVCFGYGNFCFPWNHQKTYGILLTSGGKEVNQFFQISLSEFFCFGYCFSICGQTHQHFRIASLNDGATKDKRGKIVAALGRRNMRYVLCKKHVGRKFLLSYLKWKRVYTSSSGHEIILA